MTKDSRPTTPVVVPFTRSLRDLCDKARVDLAAAKTTADAVRNVIPIRSRLYEMQCENMVLRQRLAGAEYDRDMYWQNIGRVVDHLMSDLPCDRSWQTNVLLGFRNVPLRRDA